MRHARAAYAGAVALAGAFVLLPWSKASAEEGAAARQPPVFPAQIGLVILQATVKNERGEAVRDLDRDAFTVYENGRRQQVSLFRRDEVPVSLGILLDGSRSMRDAQAEVDAAALALVRASNPEDEMFLMTFDEKPRLEVPLTRDRLKLETALRGIEAVGGTALRDAIEQAEGHLAGAAAHARKCLVVVTDGNDNASTASSSRIREDAQRDGIAILAIGLLDRADEAKASRGRGQLEELAEATGGIAYFPRTPAEVRSAAVDLARQVRSQYTIGYHPLNQALDGSYRRLRVVARATEKLVVHTRAGYRATARGASAE